MNKLINKYWTWALSILLGVAVYLFWAYPYKSVLSYQEQYQLFLFGKDYFLERIALPGGLADYIGEFLTQFYYIPVFGAAILGIIFFCLQRLTWVVCRRCGADTQWFPPSFIPALALWMYMGDENVLLCFAVSLLASLVFMWLYTLVENRTKGAAGKALFILICVPLIYWLFGANILTFIGFVALYELKKNKSFYNISLVIVFVIYALQTVLVSSYYLQYPLFRLYGGINYYRYPAYIPY
ncbi:MAG: beta-carotene 15,15'-monooxygenase, partial [Bacteroidaceae bacterium]|nr:beta-carotene 15,15'-monooxygenase [Bacteroidaceae bacterium]